MQATTPSVRCRHVAAVRKAATLCNVHIRHHQDDITTKKSNTSSQQSPTTLKDNSMNKILKRVLISLGILIALVGVLIGGFMYQFSSETSKMTSVETGRISENVFAIKDEFVNMYLIQDSSNYVAIDAGKDLKVIDAELKKLNVDADKVVAVFLTHTDMDHVAGIPLFKHARVYLARNEVKMLNGEKQKMPLYTNSISRTDYSLLEDGQTLVIGSVTVHGILTEGHTSGSMCYQVNRQYLFTGDILSLHNSKIGASVKFFDLDHEMATNAISLITNIPDVEYILTSHFGVTNDYTNAVKDWKK
jgi:hydroxyacylglutathione hydrolase